MHRYRAEASSSHGPITPDTSSGRCASDNNKPVLRHEQVESNMWPTQDPDMADADYSNDEVMCGAEELGEAPFNGSSHVQPVLPCNEVRPTSHTLQQGLRPLIRSPTLSEGKTGKPANPLDSPFVDIRVCAETAGTVPGAWQYESIGSQWEPRIDTPLTVSSPVNISEDDLHASDAEVCNTENVDKSCQVIGPSISLNSHQYANAIYQNGPLDSTRGPSTELGHEERSYTSLFSNASLLNVPLDTTPSRSVITDAGDQEELQHRRSQPRSSESSFSSTQSFADVELSPSPFELQGNILDAYQRTETGQSFLPKRALTQLITPESVKIELMNVLGNVFATTQIESYANEVCAETIVDIRRKSKIKSFRKIFALLVIAESSSSIGLFLNEDVSDLDLPLEPIKAPGIKGFRRKSSRSPLKCFERWSPTKLRLFDDNQWQMLATFFSYDSGGNVKHYALRGQHILPFVALESRGEDDNDITGGYGRVFMVHIHKDHHNFPDVDSHECDRGFAIKQQLHPTHRKSFEKEASILKKFTGKQRHKHIVSLLATYEHLGKYHLVFHRAESNLLTFWNKLKREPAFEFANVLWMAEQCAGIAEGLYRLHKQLTFTIQQKVIAAAPESHKIGTYTFRISGYP